MQCITCAIDSSGFLHYQENISNIFRRFKNLRTKEHHENLSPGFRSLGVRDGNGTEGPNEDQPTIIRHMITLAN